MAKNRRHHTRIGITDSLIRLSVGIEHGDDLIAHPTQAPTILDEPGYPSASNPKPS